VETLAGGPPSADLTYKLPGAKSAICFAFALDQSLIRPFSEKRTGSPTNATTFAPTPWPPGSRSNSRIF